MRILKKILAYIIILEAAALVITLALTILNNFTSSMNYFILGNFISILGIGGFRLVL